MNPKTAHKIEISLLIFIILLQIADFLDILPGDIDYIKKIISWTILGYLFIKVSLSTVLFGHKKIKFDILIILTYFLLIIKDIISYAQATIEEAVLLREFYIFLLTNSHIIQRYSFYLASILLLFISLYMALKFEIRTPSFMAILHETGPPPHNQKATIRFITIFLTLTAFFVVVFNLATEWLAIALDAPLVITSILLYLFIIIRYHKHFHPDNFIYKIGNIGERFYGKFIQTFHYKKTLYLGIMGLLALHLLTDVGIFIIPYVIGLKNMFYFSFLGPYHTPLIHLLQQDLTNVQGIAAISLIATYIFNIIAMLFLLLLPTFIWFKFFTQKPLHVSRTLLAVVFPSLLCFLLTPAFFIRKITSERLAGTDILTQSILTSNSVIDILIKNRITAILLVAAISILLGITIWLLEYNKKIEKDIFIVAVVVGLVFFGFYILYYFMSLYQYYINIIISLLNSFEFAIATYFIIFSIITVIFYLGGYIFFIYEVFKRHFIDTFSY